MLYAVLHHKLDETTPEPQRLEDALTSTVFGTLVMTDACNVLTAWLSRAKRVDGTREQVQAQSIDGIWFWPRLALAEPDVVLQLGDRLFVIEAKYHSGRHDLVAGDGDATDGEAPITDQLHRQWLSISDRATDHAGYPDDLRRAIATCRKTLIYVVDGRRSRRAWRQFRESIEHLPYDADCRLLTWQWLYEVIANTGLPPESPRWHALLCDYLQHLGIEGFIGLRSHSHGRSSDFAAATRWLSRLPTYAELDLHSAVGTQRGALAAARQWMINTGGADRLSFARAIDPVARARAPVLLAALAFSIPSSSAPLKLPLADFRHPFHRLTNHLRAASVWAIETNNEEHHE